MSSILTKCFLLFPVLMLERVGFHSTENVVDVDILLLWGHETVWAFWACTVTKTKCLCIIQGDSWNIDIFLKIQFRNSNYFFFLESMRNNYQNWKRMTNAGGNTLKQGWQLACMLMQWGWQQEVYWIELIFQFRLLNFTIRRSVCDKMPWSLLLKVSCTPQGHFAIYN